MAEAEEVFLTVLEGLGPEPSYERAATLESLGRCLEEGGRPDMAVEWSHDAISVLDQLDQTDSVKRQRGVA